MEYINIISRSKKGISKSLIKHSKIFEASEKSLIPILYATVDEETEVILELKKLPAINLHPEEKITIDIQPLSLEVKIKDLDDVDWHLKFSRLSNKIDVEKSTYKLREDKIYINLVKCKPKKWDHLMYHHPKVLKNFKFELKKFLSSTPEFKNRDESDLFDIWALESIPCGGDLIANLKRSGIEIPIKVITTDQVLEFMKSHIRRSSDPETMMFFTFTLYLNEKLKYEQLHPEVINEYSRLMHVEKESSVAIAEVWNIRGNDYIKQEDYRLAITAFTEAIKLDPGFPTFYFNRAVAYFHLDEDEECLLDAAVSIALDPFYYKPYIYMAKCYLMECCTDESNRLLGKAKLLEPSSNLVEDRLKESYGLRYDIDMYVKAVKLGNKKAKESHLQSITKVILPSAACERMAEFLCEKNLTAQAKVEIYNLCKIHPCNEHIIYYFLAYIAFFEDNEEEFRENARLARIRVIGHNHAKQYEHLDGIENVFLSKNRGDKFFEKKQYKEAIKCYLKAVESDYIITPIKSKCYYKIAKTYFKLDEIEESIAYIMKRINLENDLADGDVESFSQVMDVLLDFKKNDDLASGCSHKNKKKSEQCASKYSKTTTKKKSSLANEKKKSKEMQRLYASNLKDKGNKQFERKCYKEAIDTYSEAIDLDPENSIYYSNRAACHIILKNFEEGLKDAEMALSLDPSFVKGLYRKSQCFIALGKIDQAILALEKANNLKSNDKSLKSELNKAINLQKEIKQADGIYHSDNYKAAERLYQPIIKIAESCIDFRIKRITCLIKLDRYEEALLETQLTGAGDGDIYGLNYFVGICLFNTGDIGKTIEHFEHLGICHDGCENEKESGLLKLLKEFKTAIHNAPSPEHIDAKLVMKIRQKLINDLRRLGGFEEETLSFEKMASPNYTPSETQISENSPNIEKALSFMKMKKYEAALALANETLKTNDKCLKGSIIIGECNIIFGNVEKSISVFKTAKGLDSSNDEVIKGLNKALKLRNSIKNAEKAVKEMRFLNAYELYKCASRIAHKSSALLLNVAECAINLHNLSFLFKLIDSIQAEMKTSSEYYCILALGEFHSFKEENECTELIKIAIDLDPSNVKYQTYLKLFKSTYDKMAKGLESFQNKNYDKAVIYFKEGLFLGSNNIVINSEFNYYIGLIMMKQKKTLEAVDWFSEAVILKEKFIDALDHKHLQKYINVLEKRALCFKKLERLEDAVDDYSKLFQRTSLIIYKEMAEDIEKLEQNKTAFEQTSLD